MAANFNKPDLSSLEVDAVDEYKERDVDIAKMFDGTSSTNIPTNAIKFDVTSGVLQRREGGAWVTKALDIIDATTGTLSVSRGGTGAATASAARTNLSVPPTSLTISAGTGLNGGGTLSANRLLSVDVGTDPSQIPINSTLVPKSGGIFTGDITYYGGGGVSSNTSYGSLALAFNTTGSDNTANGYQALFFNTTGSNNTANGRSALSSNTTGNYNTATGYQALYSNTTGGSNTANGSLALNSNTTGSDNTASGVFALNSNTEGNNNTANGSLALYFNTEGNNNTANGYQALYSNTTGYNNTANGYQALYSNTIGSGNTANGHQALNSNTEGNNNTANGHQALNSNTEGFNNTANGYRALYSNTTGNNNTANGYRALYSNTTGSNNTANGYRALASNTTGSNNTANGYQALYSNTTGENNIANGYYALASNTTGIRNTATGSLALFSNTSYDNVSGLGYNSQVTGDDQVQLGDSNTTVYTSSGNVSSRSDLRDKADVRDTILGLDFITALRPVDYRWDQREDYKPDAPTRPEPLNNDATEQEIEAHELALSQYENDHAEWLIAVKHENLMHDGTHTRNRYHHGIIAQEIAGVIAESGVDFGGYQDHKVNGGEDVLTIAYSELIGPLIKALQEVNQKLDVLKQEFDDYVETHS